MSDDPTTPAEMLAMAAYVPHPEDDPPGYEVQLPWLNMTIGVAADTVEEARANENVIRAVEEQIARSAARA
jgi:hypothetical protein